MGEASANEKNVSPVAGQGGEPESAAAHTYRPAEEEKLRIERQKVDIEREKIELEQEKTARSRWVQEDSLVHNRVTWLIQTQAFLFAAFGLLSKEKNTANEKDIDAVLTGIPILGVLLCLLIAIGICAAWSAQICLLKDYESKHPSKIA